MRRPVRTLLVGVALLLAAMGSDLLGTADQSLFLLVLALVLAVAGALVAVRGLFDFLGERL